MEICIFESVVDGFCYRVFYDDISPLDVIDKSIFETAEEFEEYIERFKGGFLSLYVVVKKQKCDCCENYKTIDSLGAIDAEDASEALAFYLKNYNSEV